MHSECFCARIASLAACASGLGGPRPLVIFFQKKFAFVTGLVTECARRRTAELDRRITSRGFAHSLTRSLAHSLALSVSLTRSLTRSLVSNDIFGFRSLGQCLKRLASWPTAVFVSRRHAALFGNAVPQENVAAAGTAAMRDRMRPQKT